jgi:hypothetical protein
MLKGTISGSFVLTSLLAFIRSLAALKLGQGLGTTMIMMMEMIAFDV